MPSSEVDSTEDDKEPGECKCGLVYAPGNLTPVHRHTLN
jgi:hypothetical protein